MFFPINTLLAILYSSWPVPRFIVLGPMELLDNDYRTIFFSLKIPMYMYLENHYIVL